jgi:hypothetical protein
VVIIPSERLVIVRMGMAYTPRADIDAVERLVADVVADTPDQRAKAATAARS